MSHSLPTHSSERLSQERKKLNHRIFCPLFVRLPTPACLPLCILAPPAPLAPSRPPSSPAVHSPCPCAMWTSCPKPECLTSRRWRCDVGQRTSIACMTWMSTSRACPPTIHPCWPLSCAPDSCFVPCHSVVTLFVVLCPALPCPALPFAVLHAGGRTAPACTYWSPRSPCQCPP